MSIKAISTKYKGYNFRSRLEARWGVYFDAMGIKWEYEKEGFRLGYEFEDGEGYYNYLPDFWLPDLKMWAEVKPEEFTDEEEKKAELLTKETGRPVLKLIGVPERKPYFAIEPYFVIEGIAVPFKEYAEDVEKCKEPNLWFCNYALSNYHNYPKDEHRFYSSFDDDEINEEWFDDIDEYVEKAKSTRFEFKEGEDGNTKTIAG